MRLAEELAERGHEVGVLCPRIRPGRPQNSLIEESIGPIRVWGLVQNYPYRDLPEAVSDPAIDRVAKSVLKNFSPDLLAIQTLAGLSLGILDVARELGIPRVLHLHDAWWSCPSGGQRRRPDGGLCAPVSKELCGPCFSSYRHREGPLERASRWIGGRMPAALPPDALHRSFEALPPRARQGLKKIHERAATWTRAAATPPARTPNPLVDERITNRHQRIKETLLSLELVLSPTLVLLQSLRDDGLVLPSALVVPTGVPLGHPPRERNTSGPLRVLFAGTWVEHKGPHVLAQALASGDCDISARAAGPAPFPAYREAALSSSQGRLQPVGTLKPHEVREQMDWSDVVVVPSRWEENAPLVVLEARAAGRPVIASDIGGLPELVEEGVDGHLFPPGDWMALRHLLSSANALRQLPVRPPRSLNNFVDEVQSHYRGVVA